MNKIAPRKPEYDTELFADDMAKAGLLPIDVARKARVSHTSVGRFLRHESQTPRMAKRLARVLNQTPERYLRNDRNVSAEAAPRKRAGEDSRERQQVQP